MCVMYEESGNHDHYTLISIIYKLNCFSVSICNKKLRGIIKDSNENLYPLICLLRIGAISGDRLKIYLLIINVKWTVNLGRRLLRTYLLVIAFTTCLGGIKDVLSRPQWGTAGIEKGSYWVYLTNIKEVSSNKLTVAYLLRVPLFSFLEGDHFQLKRARQ